MIVKIKSLEDKYKDTEGNIYVNQKEVLNIIYNAVKPKVAIPKYVADWIEKCKEVGGSCRYAFSSVHVPKEVNIWLSGAESVLTNEEAFCSAWFYGYEIEGKAVYTVRIAGATLTKITRGITVQYRMIPFGDDSLIYTGDSVYTTHLTEADIKGYDKRLWELAVPVEEK